MLTHPHCTTTSSNRWPRFWTVAGCMAVFAQLGGMAYLTWWELSWDVMEPIGGCGWASARVLRMLAIFVYNYFACTVSLANEQGMLGYC